MVEGEWGGEDVAAFAASPAQHKKPSDQPFDADASTVLSSTLIVVDPLGVSPNVSGCFRFHEVQALFAATLTNLLDAKSHRARDTAYTSLISSLFS